MLNFREDATAFRAFIEAHQQRVYNLVLKMVQHVHDAEEITQDVFVDIYRKPDAYRGNAAISTWLYRIAMNKCIDHLRRQQRKKRHFLPAFLHRALPMLRKNLRMPTIPVWRFSKRYHRVLTY
jgi:RNA polymerase sigma-70 factor (ECF subfamily)